MGTFDADFDFTSILNKITVEINHIQSRLDECILHCANIEDCVGYDAMKLSVTNQYATKMDKLTNDIEGYQNIFNSLTAMQTIPEEHKTLLHSMWKLTTLPAELFMYMMAHNYAELILDTDIVTITSDNANSLDAKKMIANIIMSKYGLPLHCIF